jgi:SnoaL-like domain
MPDRPGRGRSAVVSSRNSARLRSATPHANVRRHAGSQRAAARLTVAASLGQREDSADRCGGRHWNTRRWLTSFSRRPVASHLAGDEGSHHERAICGILGLSLALVALASSGAFAGTATTPERGAGHRHGFERFLQRYEAPTRRPSTGSSRRRRSARVVPRSAFEYLVKDVRGRLAYTVAIERSDVLYAGQTALHPQVLRVTMIFRFDHGGWKIVHRHADTMVDLQLPS